MIIKLERPLRVGEKGAEITELVLRERLCAGDYRGLKLGSLMTTVGEVPIDDYLKIASRLSGQPDAVINDLGEADLAQVISAINDFREASHGKKTTITESP